MRIIGLDLSTKTGWSVFDDESLTDFGLLSVELEDINVNDNPNKNPKYPFNILKGSKEMSRLVWDKVLEFNPDKIVIELTTKGRNRTYST